jgi:hypothetical protein
MARFDKFLRLVKDGARELGKDLFKDFDKEALADARAFLKQSEDDLRQWTRQLSRKEMTKKEFNVLVKGQKDLAELAALTKAGIGLAKLERFRTKLIDLVVDSAFSVFA